MREYFYERVNVNYFFSRVIDNSSNNKEAIYKILKERGFLLENVEGHFFLSDNAHKDDIEYLEYGFLGRIETIKKPDYMAWIHINVNALVRDAIQFFCEKERIAYVVCMQKYDWKYFFRRTYGKKIPVRNLEPFVAYYVKALSSCGVLTNFSCDGNHTDNGIVRIGADYPFDIWMDCIMEIMLPEDYRLKYNSIERGAIAIDKLNKYITYYELYRRADWIYTHRYEIRMMKKWYAQK